MVPRGEIISNGFYSGLVSAYIQQTDETAEYLKIGQAESMAILNNKLCIGVYPGAFLFEYVISQIELKKTPFGDYLLFTNAIFTFEGVSYLK